MFGHLTSDAYLLTLPPPFRYSENNDGSTCKLAKSTFNPKSCFDVVEYAGLSPTVCKIKQLLAFKITEKITHKSGNSHTY